MRRRVGRRSPAWPRWPGWCSNCFDQQRIGVGGRCTATLVFVAQGFRCPPESLARQQNPRIRRWALRRPNPLAEIQSSRAHRRVDGTPDANCPPPCPSTDRASGSGQIRSGVGRVSRTWPRASEHEGIGELSGISPRPGVAAGPRRARSPASHWAPRIPTPGRREQRR